MRRSELKAHETSVAASPDAGWFTSYSLNFEDVILHRLFSSTLIGLYVDVGAGHPRFENDTFALYHKGWHGINIEPNDEFHSALVQERPRDINLQVVLSDSSDGTVTYYKISGSGLSTCDVEQARAYQVAGRDILQRELPVTTLSGILTEAAVGHINILKVDVEGFEEKVLNGNDWERFRPDVVVVDATYPESPVRRSTNILSSMEQRGYRHVHFDGLNDFYMEREFAAAELPTLPPNVFDHFVLRETVDLRAQLKAIQIEFKRAEEYAHALVLENRRLGRAGEQMRAELLTMNQLLEPLHAITEQVERQKEQLRQQKEQLRQQNEQLQQQNEQLQQQNEQLQQQKESLVVSCARLNSVYSSLSWRLTAPLRLCNGIQRRIVARLRKRLRGVD
jgi:FkbM family methyltransferase